MNKKEAKELPRWKRYKLRKSGVDVPMFSAGAPKGYKQTELHIEKRKRFGAEHHNWKGDNIVEKSGRTRAERKYTVAKCEKCGSENKRLDRHHIDGNTKNNNRSNVVVLCRKCHMVVDGRYKKLVETAKRNQPKAVAARWN